MTGHGHISVGKVLDLPYQSHGTGIDGTRYRISGLPFTNSTFKSQYGQLITIVIKSG